MPAAHFVVWMLSAGVMAAHIGTGTAQEYPNRPIRVVTGAPAGGADQVARLVAQNISGPLGQAVIVDNRAGSTAGEIVARAAPDGYTLLVAGSSLWIEPLFRRSSGDPLKGLAPVSLLVNSPNVLVVPPAMTFRSVKDLIDAAKAKPGVLNYASGATGGSPHVAGELFKAMTGVNIVGIPYKGTAAALTDLISGQVQLMFAAASSVTPHIKSGRLRPLAVGNAQPSALFPDLPTVAVTVPGYDMSGATALLAPRGVAAAVINRLTRETVTALNLTDVKDKFFNAGAETVASSPQQLASKIQSETARIGKLVETAGLREQ